MTDERESGPPADPPSDPLRHQVSPDRGWWWNEERWVPWGRGGLGPPAYPDPHTIVAVASAGGFLTAFATAVGKVLGEAAGNALLRALAGVRARWQKRRLRQIRTATAPSP